MQPSSPEKIILPGYSMVEAAAAHNAGITPAETLTHPNSLILPLEIKRLLEETVQSLKSAMSLEFCAAFSLLPSQNSLVPQAAAGVAFKFSTHLDLALPLSPAGRLYLVLFTDEVLL